MSDQHVNGARELSFLGARDAANGTRNQYVPDARDDTFEATVASANSDAHLPIIAARDAGFRYHGAETDALHGVTLAAEPGACVLLCGRSGCGKTTLTHLLNGLSPDFFAGELTGTVACAGREAGDATVEDYVGVVGSVFQNPKTQYFNVNTTAELAFPCENSGWEPTAIHGRVAEVAKRFDLEGLLGRSIFQLSGGEKQRIACGAACMLGPEVLVLDEPTSNLDQATIVELHDMVARMKAQGMTVVIAEHRLAWVAGLVDRCFLFEDGRVREAWSGDEFRALDEPRLAELGLRSLDLTPYREEVARKAGLGHEGQASVEDEAGSADSLQPSPLIRTRGTGPFRSNSRHAGTLQPGPLQSARLQPGPLLPTPLQPSPLIRTRGLTLGYGKRHPVRAVGDLALASGEIVALMGHNGCGKSTLARTLCGLIRPLAGEVLWQGRAAKPAELVSHAFLVMQDVNYQLFSDSVRDEVLLGAHHADECDAVLDALGLAELADRHPMSLSGGQKQRVAVASAMLSGKELVVLDEPTSGLDRHHMEQVGLLLRGLADRGACVLVITHDEELAASACDRVVMLDGTCGR